MTAVVKTLAMSIHEVVLQDNVVKMAQSLGYKVHYARKSAAEGKDGRWRGLSPMGWPDLFMVKNGHAWAVELKSQEGRVTPEQEAWLAVLGRVPGISVAVWRPSDWQDGTVRRALEGK